SEAVDDERVAALEVALDTIDPVDSPLRALVLATLASELAFSPDYDRRQRLAAEAEAVARRLGDPAILARVLGLRLFTLWVPPARGEWLGVADELAALAKRLDDPLPGIWTTLVRFGSAVEAGDMEAAVHSLGLVSRIAGDLAQPFFQWFVPILAHMLARIAGRLEEAEALAEEAHEIGRAAGVPDAFHLYSAQVFWLRYDQGRLGEVVDLYVQAAARERSRSATRAAGALALTELDRGDEARAVLAPLAARSFDVSPLSITWLFETTILAEACARVGEPAWAELLYRRLAPWGDLVATAAAGAVSGSVHHYLGLLDGSMGRHDAADVQFAEAAAVHARMGAPAFLARTRLEWARTLLSRRGPGDGKRARQLLEEALGVARDLGLGTVEQRAVVLLEEVDQSPKPRRA
ncbi:MAG: hypothetical protein ACRD0C_13560, partial [Acidimicrobiia bacterium]